MSLDDKLIQHKKARLGHEVELEITPEMVEYWQMLGFEQCEHYNCARLQRLTEISQGLGKKGTIGYEMTGCYDCKGFDPLCNARYVSGLREVEITKKYIASIEEKKEE